MNSNLTRSLYLIALAHLTIELCANFLPVVYPILISDMGLTYAQVGLIALVLGSGTTLAQPFFGYLSDRWNPRRMAVLSILWVGILMGLVGFTWNYLSLVLLVGLSSLGSAAFHPPGATIASTSNIRRRGTAVSIFSVGGNLGTALSPLWVAVGIGWLGLQGTTVVTPVAVLVSLLLYRQLSWHSGPGQVPSSTGQGTGGGQSQPQTQNGSLVGLILIILVVMCRSWFQLSLVTYLPEWMQSQGWSLAGGGQILSVLLVSVGIGSFTGGILSDRIGGWQVMALSLGLLAPAQWLFLGSSGLLQVGLVGLIGILIGASFPVSIIMAQETWPHGVGLASALVMGLGWAPGGIGASLTGLIADQSSLAVGLQSLIIPPLLGVIFALAYAALRRQSTGSEALSDAQRYES